MTRAISERPRDESERYRGETDRPFSGPIFLIGMPRSGTKLLRDLMNGHSSIRIPGSETAFFPYIFNNWQQFGNLETKIDFTKFYLEISKSFFFENMAKQGRPLSEKRIRLFMNENSPAGVFEAIVRAATDNPATTNVIWGDKSPSYIEHLELLSEQYPNAKFIHIVRDVRDYCLSINKAWKKNMQRAAYRWGCGVLRARADGSKIPERYLEIRYEDLISSPEKELSRICGFLALEFQNSMLVLQKPAENLGATKGIREIVASNKNKFLGQLDPKTLKKIEEVAYQAMLAFEYKPLVARRYRAPSNLLLSTQRFIDGINLARAVRREHGLLKGTFLHFQHNRIK